MRSRVPAPPEVHPWDAEGALQQGRLVVRLGLETELSVTQPILRWGLWGRADMALKGLGKISVSICYKYDLFSQVSIVCNAVPDEGF